MAVIRRKEEANVESQRIVTINQFLQFLENQNFNYAQKVKDLLLTNERRLIINLDQLRKHDSELFTNLISNPSQYIGPLQDAIKKFVLQENDEKIDLKDEKFYAGFSGSLGRQEVSPRALDSSLLSRLVAVRGIVTKCSMVHERLLKAVQFCEATGRQRTENFADPTDPDCGISAYLRPKTQDEEGNPLTFEYGMCVFTDHQTATLQELPEHAPTGQLPRSVRLVIDRDLVDRVKPGDRIEAFGIYQVREHNGIFPTFIVVNSMQKINDSADENIFTTSDIENIKEVAKFAPFERLSCSLAPSIFGHEYIKKAMLLQLMNGVEKTTQTGMHLRGDIHILLVGDPSTAKSQLLRCVLNVAPLAVSANGRGASGVGLTAAITSDPETRERVLEAGAMVLADRGIVCIDEFDKMDTNDRAALHEVMEQQTVTIQKAGIHTSLNARCSVLAAANPLFGNYNRERSPTENIGFPDSLLSRFDLLFVVLDNMDMASDRVLSEHVLKMHRYNATATKTQLRGTQGVRLEELAAAHDGETTEIFSSEEKLIFGTSATLFSTGFLRKYIEYARRLVQPTLSPACCSVLSEAYSELRSSASLGTLPITARALDSLVRLTEAHARCRLSQVAEECDARVAVEMMRYALYGEKRKVESLPPTIAEKRRREDDDIDVEETPADATQSSNSQQNDDTERSEMQTEPQTETQGEGSETQTAGTQSTETQTPQQLHPLSVVDVSAVRGKIRDTVASMLEQETSFSLLELVGNGGGSFIADEAEVVLREMEREGIITYDEHIIYSNN